MVLKSKHVRCKSAVHHSSEATRKWESSCEADGGAVLWQVLERRLRRIAEEISASVAEEVEFIAAEGLPLSTASGWALLTSAFPSADLLLDEIQVPLQRECLAVL